MRLVLIVMHAILMEYEGKSDAAIEREMTGKPENDMAAFAEIVGQVAVKAWDEGVSAGQAMKGRPEKKLKPSPEIRGNIDGRVSSAFAEASGVLGIRLGANQKNKRMMEKILMEYIKSLKGTARAAIHDAANAGILAGAR